MSDAELEATWGGARDPKWTPGERKRLKPDIQLFVEKNNGVSNSVKIANRGISNGRHEPINLFEQMAMHEVKSDPLKNAVSAGKIKMGDPRWPAEEGWVKMRRVITNNNGEKTIIHFLYNNTSKEFDDFKFKLYIKK